MATTQEILDAAVNLGKLIATHEAAKKFEGVMKKLEGEVEAQRLLNDYHRHLSKLGEKEAKGEPIEVEDKRQLESLQNQVVNNAVLRDIQMAQMDYLDLMRRVDEAISGGPKPAGGAPGVADLGAASAGGPPPG